MNISDTYPRLFHFLGRLRRTLGYYPRKRVGVGSFGQTAWLWFPMLFLFLLFPGDEALGGKTGRWKRLEADKIHDPRGPAIGELQQPGDALSALPRDSAGNRVNWIKALRDGVITPRTNLFPETNIQVLDLDIIYPNTGNYAFVKFPHKPHTEWLDCVNCHDKIFKPQYRGTPITMRGILEGNYCGQCHGAVAFPLTECDRCHSVNPRTFRGKFGPQEVKP